MTNQEILAKIKPQLKICEKIKLYERNKDIIFKAIFWGKGSS